MKRLGPGLILALILGFAFLYLPILALIASHVATLITHESPDLLKTCTGPDCTLWFIDRTKAHRRMFCSAAGCGNRAKVAAFRERQREQ